MVRRHGWELPAHAFQVVAITVFFLLLVAYYVFFAPFVGFEILEIVAISLYSSLALSVFFLYVRCTGINPADEGVYEGQLDQKINEFNEAKGLVSESSGSVVHRHGSSDVPVEEPQSFFCLACGCLFGWMFLSDGCKREAPVSQSSEEDVLYCTLCNAEVHKFSKHCRSCDKCVDGFDHHCRWLNNCVGRKNYSSFVALMATSLTLLILQWGTGVGVIARCFVDKSGTSSEIVEKLGNGFSRAPFAAVVAVCTAVSLLASIPLGELFFFHIILMKKGITTYEYVVAMRAQNDQQQVASAEGDVLSAPSSPGSSTATGLTGSSSQIGLQYRGAWCTPPRVFIDHQDEIIPHLEPGRVPSTVDPDSIPRPDRKPQKPQVRISAWKLAKLNPSEAAKAAAKARENSSVLRQVTPGGKGMEASGDYSSSDMGSSRSSASTDFGGLMRGKRSVDEGRFTASKLDVPRSREDHRHYGVHFDSAMTSSRSSISSPRHILNDSDGLSPLPSKPSYAQGVALRLSTPRQTQTQAQQESISNAVRSSSSSNPLSSRLNNTGQRFTSWVGGRFGGAGDGSSVDSLDDRSSGFLGKSSSGKRNSVFSYIRQAWPDVSTTTSYDLESGQRVPATRAPPAREMNPGLARKQEEAPAPAPAPRRKVDELLYPENTIFFGGPLPIPGSGGRASQQAPIFHPAPGRSAAESAVFQASNRFLAPLRGGGARTHSPVFAPRLFNHYPPPPPPPPP